MLVVVDQLLESTLDEVVEWDRGGDEACEEFTLSDGETR